MATYTQAQVEQYYKSISFNTKLDPWTSPLAFLQALQTQHMSCVSFNSLALHYSPHRYISLDPSDLFDKIVINGRGGYCMEVNTFFAAILRTLGYQVYSAGARVKHMKWSHMVNLVTIDDVKYLVDVGFGSKAPTQPVPLRAHQFDNICARTGRLELKRLPQQHTDASQRLLVYAVRSAGDDNKWEEMYSFNEVEFFAADFDVMNYYVSTNPRSWFVREVMAVRVWVDDEGGLGEMILHQDCVKCVRSDGRSAVIKMLASEAERVEALEQYFDVVLTEREQRSIKGLVSEIKGP